MNGKLLAGARDISMEWSLQGCALVVNPGHGQRGGQYSIDLPGAMHTNEVQENV